MNELSVYHRMVTSHGRKNGMRTRIYRGSSTAQRHPYAVQKDVGERRRLRLGATQSFDGVSSVLLNGILDELINHRDCNRENQFEPIGSPQRHLIHLRQTSERRVQATEERQNRSDLTHSSCVRNSK